jgi:hypothetical protein
MTPQADACRRSDERPSPDWPACSPPLRFNRESPFASTRSGCGRLLPHRLNPHVDRLTRRSCPHPDHPPQGNRVLPPLAHVQLSGERHRERAAVLVVNRVRECRAHRVEEDISRAGPRQATGPQPGSLGSQEAPGLLDPHRQCIAATSPRPAARGGRVEGAASLLLPLPTCEADCGRSRCVRPISPGR